MGIYSPIAATYGVRVEQFLESDSDFVKYHAKLNKKLIKLRHHCGLVTKDTRRYTTKEKFSKVTVEDYDKKNKLFGALVLLLAERDLALAETLKLRARQRGKLKDGEKKVLSTRLKKTCKTIEKLIELTQNEAQWVTRAQYLIYGKLAKVEYLMYGKHAKRKESSNIARNLALALAGLQYLNQLKHVDAVTLEAINSKYEYALRQHSGNVISSADLRNFITKQVEESAAENDELAKLLLKNGYTLKLVNVDVDAVKSSTHIQWRSFTAEVHDPEVVQAIEEAKKIVIKDVSDYSDMLLKWSEAVDKQETRLATMDEDEQMLDEDDNKENDQILLSYLKYNMIFVSILRDNSLFTQLLKQWEGLGPSISAKLTKYKELDRIVKNLLKYLQDVMELPGVYSDDQLMSQLECCKIYYQLNLNSQCLAPLYQSKGKYMEALALYVDSLQKLESKLEDIGNMDEIVLPDKVLNKKNLKVLDLAIKLGLKSVVALAEYEKSLNKDSSSNYEASLIEKIDTQSIEPQDINLNNLFPLRPKIQPISSKPTLFDLAFNYINYEEEQPVSPAPAKEKLVEEPQVESQKKKGFLGLFGR
ncbi:hypothetical protein NCAS_0G01160 [Naumovozyma castellii]|uniref:Signal recognition particle subunit SRP68 n=1 Tax=Naumovozyma castellii TaxID=27288 RepID=G0VHW9_NAUCA|nr:hypothetical protein NCAS_0G01160 [Naumovozyma castellii CBS 4309]CCC71003.1 hypothetical protein NCAS_0G01160 [Naumovozyma castellii CBS 4309]